MDTELGTLLLDPHLQGQLYVRQVWVSDQTKDGLAVGVNFKTSVSALLYILFGGVVHSARSYTVSCMTHMFLLYPASELIEIGEQ